MRYKHDLTTLSAADIGRTVSLEWDGYLGASWYVEGYLSNVQAEQEYIEDRSLCDTEPTRTLTNTAYTVRVAGWEQTFESWEAPHIIVSFTDEVD